MLPCVKILRCEKKLLFYLPSMGIHHAPFLCLTNIFELEMTQNTVLCSSISCAVLNMQSDEKVIKRG